MVPVTHKRAKNLSRLRIHSKKRLRTQTTQNPAPNVIKTPVLIDDLPWNQVQLPRDFKDAEGFLELEEINDVEIIREGEILKFTIATPHVTCEDDEFEGFDNDDDEPGYEDMVMKNKSTMTKTSSIEEFDRTDKTEGTDHKWGPKVKKKDSQLQGSQANGFKALSEVMDIRETDMSAWVELNISSYLLTAISKMGFSRPSPIQSAAIPEILNGHDVIGKASTGSGKTLAFVIPIVESWIGCSEDLNESEPVKPRRMTALILTPTRELAHQITDHTSKLCQGLLNAPQTATVTGGLSIQKQHRKLSTADIIIGTPGRLWEVISSSQQILESLKLIKFLVIDEADRLLSEGHFKEVEEIIKALDQTNDAEEDFKTPISRQTLIFSATLQKSLQQKLTGKGKNNLLSDSNDSVEYLLEKLNFREAKPKFVDVNPTSQMAENLREGIVECAGIEKDLYLYALLLYHPNQRILIFTNSIHSVRRLTPMLQNLSLPVQALHSHMAQKARMRSIERFSLQNTGRSILVATDVAARGLDIGGVQLVIHYHLPRTADVYVHRSGRTARAQATGTSILICAPQEVVGMRRLVAKVHVQNSLSRGEGRGSKAMKYYLRSLNINRKIVERLKPRVSLAKQIADSSVAKEKKISDNEWLKTAALELGVEYSSDESGGGRRKGRGTGRRLKDKAARAFTKNDLRALREELRYLLSQRINIGFSEKYLATGSMDVNELLDGAKGDFFGTVDLISMDDTK